MKTAFIAVLVAAGVCVFGQGIRPQIITGTGQQPPVPVGKGSIEGTVVNGLTGEPVKRAQVSISGRVFLVAVTDSSGHFAFKQLAAGGYVVQAQSPNFSYDKPALRAPINLAEEESKKDVVIPLTPVSSLTGKVLDEDGAPMTNCSVSVMQTRYDRGRKRFSMRAGAPTTDKGEYRITHINPGSYIVFARCGQTVMLPHPFIRRNSGAEYPTLSYPPQFYPGAADPATATKVQVSPGVETNGIDFHLSPAAGITVRGRFGATDPEVMARPMRLILVSRDPALRDWLQMTPEMNQESKTFRFRNVQPGSYEILADTFGDGSQYHARVPVEVGNVDPQPVDVTLAPGASLAGTIVLDGDLTAPFENMQVYLAALENSYGGQPNAKVEKDGSFAFTDVTPGKWRIYVNNIPGYVQSIAVENREIPGNKLDFSAGIAGPLKITVSGKWAQVEGSVSGLPSEVPAQLHGMLIADDDVPNMQRTFGVNPQGTFQAGGLIPGTYYGCVVSTPEHWKIFENPDAVAALKNRCEKFEVRISSQASSIHVPYIPDDDFQKILQSGEGQ